MEDLVRYVISHTEKGEWKHCGTCTKRLTKECDSILVHDLWLCSANAPTRDIFVKLVLEEFPDVENLRAGISFPRVLEIFGDRIIALRFMGLGALLGVWELDPPAPIGITFEDVRKPDYPRGIIHIRSTSPHLRKNQAAKGQ